MTTIRQELETRITALANAQVPPLKVAYEDVAFDPSALQSFLEVTIVPAATVNVTVNGNRIREFGVMQVNVWCKTGKGAGVGESIADKIIAAFPVVPEIGTVCITSNPYKSRAIKDESGWRIVPVTINYRREGEIVPT